MIACWIKSFSFQYKKSCALCRTSYVLICWPLYWIHPILIGISLAASDVPILLAISWISKHLLCWDCQVSLSDWKIFLWWNQHCSCCCDTLWEWYLQWELLLPLSMQFASVYWVVWLPLFYLWIHSEALLSALFRMAAAVSSFFCFSNWTSCNSKNVIGICFK